MKKRFTFFFILSLLLFSINIKLNAKVPETKAYTFTISGVEDTGKEMIKAAFSSKVLVTKKNLNYCFIELTNEKVMKDFSLFLNDEKVGTKDYSVTDNKKLIVYTVSEENLFSKFTVKLFVTAMNAEVGFEIKLNKESESLTETVFNEDFDYPSEFVPSFTEIKDKNYFVNQNALFSFPKAAAKLKGSVISIKKFLLLDNKLVEVENEYTFLKSGNYKLIYKAFSSLYKTYKGNDSESILELNISVFSQAEDVTLNTSDLSVKVYGKSSNLLGKTLAVKSDNFDKFSLAKRFKKRQIYEIFLNDEHLKLNESVKIYLKLNPNLNREKVKVYEIKTGKLIKVNGLFNEDYFVFETNELGVFLVAETTNKIALIISLSCALTVILISVPVGIILIKHKKKKDA